MNCISVSRNNELHKFSRFWLSMSNEGNTRFTFPGKTKESEVIMVIIYGLHNNINLMDWIGLAWLGLALIGLDWVGLGWVGLDWIGLNWIIAWEINHSNSCGGYYSKHWNYKAERRRKRAENVKHCFLCGKRTCMQYNNFLVQQLRYR